MSSRLLVPWALMICFAALPDSAVPDQAPSLDLVTTPEAPRFELLFMGNSHSASNDLPGLVTKLIRTGIPGAQTSAQLAPGYRYLADRINDGESHGLLLSRSWTHVVLQAQKYSTTGRYFYPTDAAEEWIRRITAQNAQAIMFPEWPRLGNTEEGLRVHNLHRYIASNEPACVAPIGLAWEASLDQHPQISLHAPDGNHSNLAGALLTAFVLFEVVTGQKASKLPDVQTIAIQPENQQKLRQIASEVINQNRDECTASIDDTGTEPASVAAIDERIPTLDQGGRLALTLLVALMGLGALVTKTR